MHIILEKYTNELCQNFEHDKLSDSKKFEIFCNYCTVSKHYFGRFDPIDVTTDEDDASIDGIAIIIDGELVRTIDDAIEIFKTHKTNLSADLIFVQTKTSDSFKKNEISNFKMGIEDYLSLNPKLPNGKLNKDSLEIFLKLLDNLHKIKNRRPNIHVYYCTTGTYSHEKEISASFDILERSIKETELFYSVAVTPLGRGEILKLYTTLTEKNEARLKVIEYLGMPKMPGIPQSYIAVVNAKTFVESLLMDSDGNFKPAVFEENVRSYLGENNDVNAAIQDTLRSDEKKSLFSVLNNGITIVAPELTLTPNTKDIHLANYQIINGCQTSSTLFENISHLNENVNVVIKFIESPENESSSEIIAATNSQSDIPKESFFGLRSKAKLVQKYFIAQNQNCQPENYIYFERRQGEFKNSGYQSTRIFDVRELARCYAAMFLDTPHNSARYVSRIFLSNDNNLFRENDAEAYYYASALTLYKYQSLINGKRIGAQNFTKLRWHIIYIFKWLCLNTTDFPAPNSKKAEKEAQKIVNILNSDTKSYIPIFEECQTLMKEIGIPSDDALKRNKFTTDLRISVENYIKNK
jgi:hypothetical protein